MVRMINNLLIRPISVHISSRNSNSRDYFSIRTYCSSRFLDSSEVIFELLLIILILILLSCSLIYWPSRVQPIFTVFWSDRLFMVIGGVWRGNQIFELRSLWIVIISVTLSIKEPSTCFPRAATHILWISTNWIIFRWLRPPIR